MKKILNDNLDYKTIKKLADPSKQERADRLADLTYDCKYHPEITARDFAALEEEYWKLRKAYEDLRRTRATA